jgi:hypothetical protein
MNMNKLIKSALFFLFLLTFIAGWHVGTQQGKTRGCEDTMNLVYQDLGVKNPDQNSLHDFCANSK